MSTRRTKASAWLALSLSVLGAGVSAAEPDPWSRVPVLPTACYQADGFAEKLAAARDVVKADLERQESVNRELSETLKTIDPMELATRQQQWMMANPQAAAELMQRYAQVAETTATDEMASHEQLIILDQDLQALHTRYDSALDQALAPIQAKFEDLDARAQKDLVPQGEQYVYAPWAVKESNALTLEENAAYEGVCAEWWSAAGPYHGWLKRYREQLVQRIPKHEEAENIGAGFMAVALSTPEATYRPTAKLKALDQYLDKVGRVFERRRQEPGKPQAE